MFMSTVHRSRTRILLASTALGCALAVPGLSHAQTLPTGGSVAAGSVTIAQPSATQMNITQSSQSAVVNWQGFSVGQGGAVNIAQPNASSAILNRVTGNAPSTIAGSITANGQVYLVNPNGIAITKSGTVNVGGGFVASTLGIADDDFMAGRRNFGGSGASASVSNAGTITVGRGGYAALIGGTVSNSGSISVPLGKVGLGSGERATLDFAGDGFLQVAMPTDAAGKGALIRNSGSITADGGSVIISAATAREAARSAINISGLVQARSIGGRSGSIVIGGGAGGKVRITGRLIATSRHADGGTIQLTGKDVKLKGATVDASGATGGGKINIGEAYQNQAATALTGTTTIDGATTIRADATSTGNGGAITVSSDGTTRTSGLITALGAAGGKGGTVQAIGQNVALENNAVVDVSGPAGGGTVLVGGDFQGKNPAILNAFRSYVGPDATIKADAIAVGDGGKVIVWADDVTRFYGNISARGGADGGNGGLVETSGKRVLDFLGLVDTRAPRGETGALWLDPTSIYIAANQTNATAAGMLGFDTTTGGPTSAPSGTNQDSLLTTSSLETALATSNVVVTTSNPSGTGAGKITVVDPFTWATANSLTLTADNAIAINAAISATGGAAINLNALGTISQAAGALISTTGTLTTSSVGGTTLTSANAVGTFNATNITSGDVVLTNTGPLTITGINQSGGGDVSVTNTGGGITINGGVSAAAGGLTLSSGGTISDTGAISVVRFTLAAGNWVQNAATLPSFSAADFQITGGSFLRATGGDGTSGNPYTLTDIYGVQGIGSSAALRVSSYQLATNIDASGTGGWNAGAGFSPIGNGPASFTGVLDGQGHVVSGLTIDRPGTDNVGLIGAMSGSGALVSNIGLTGGSIRGQDQVGGLVGFNDSGTVQRSYATGAVAGRGSVGGLVGENHGGTISLAYATGNVAGGRDVGGLVGRNTGSISNVYASGNVSGDTTGAVTHANIGGLIGENNGSVSNAFGTGLVQGSGFSNVHGLIGVQTGGSLSNGYYNIDTSGQSTDGGGATGLTASQMMQQQSFSGFDFAAVPVWRIYEGHTAPLLKDFLTPYTVTISGGGNTTKTYDGTSASFSGSAGTLPSSIKGTLGYDGAVNVGMYFVGGLYSTVYDVGYAGNSGLSTALTIIPRPVTATVGVTKVYDATLGYNAPSPTYAFNNVLAADAASLGINAAILFVDKNVGTNKAINISGPMLTGNVHGNYQLTSVTSDGTSSITPATLTISGASAASKVYDGTIAATVSGGSLSGVFGGDTVTLSQSGIFDTRNVGTAKTVTETFGLSGTDAGNYVLASSTATTTANITAATLTASGASAASKVYDGTTAATVSGGSLSGVFGGDTVTLSRSGSFDTKNVGTAKTVTETFGLSGTDAGNYVLASSTATTTADITQRTMTVTAAGANKVYDGLTTATVSLGDNRVAGDVLTLADTAASFADRNAGTGKTVSVFGITVGGADAGNYSFNTTATTTANISQAQLTVSAAGVNRVYDASTGATVMLSDNHIAGDSLTLNYGSASFADKNAGTGKMVSVSGITVGGTDAGNYSFNTTATTIASITQAALSFGAVSAAKIYDGTTASPAAPTVSGLRGADTVSGLSQSYDSANVGSRILSLNGGYVINDGNGGANYTLAIGSAVAGSITPRPITVVADPQSRTLGDPNPPLTYAVGGLGLVNGDTLSGGLATAATPQSDAGSYAITQATLAASRNYALTYVGADLTVKPAPSVNNSATNSPVNPVVVSSPAYQPPKVTSINFETAPNAPDPLIASTQSAPNTPTAAVPDTDSSKQTAASAGDITTGNMARRKRFSSTKRGSQP
jgi:filamentous hemagglutinin family protein